MIPSITKIVEKFKFNPKIYYATSICATWAGGSSLIIGMQMVREYGIVPFLLWAFGNTITCILFGIFAPLIPKMRDFVRTKVFYYVLGIMAVFQVWLNMNNIQSAISETSAGQAVSIAVPIVISVLFIIILWKHGIIRNVLTDHYGWILVYILLAVVAIISFLLSGFKLYDFPIGATQEMIAFGWSKCWLLIPGSFLYPYFWELMDYNDCNDDGTRSVNIRLSFVYGGLLFGFYLVFVFLLAIVNYVPALSICKAVLVILIASSTLSSFLYSLYFTFPKKIGLVIGCAAVASWQFLIPLGVMGLWTLMSEIRQFIVAGAIIFSLLWYTVERYKGRNLRGRANSIRNLEKQIDTIKN